MENNTFLWNASKAVPQEYILIEQSLIQCDISSVTDTGGVSYLMLGWTTSHNEHFYG